jgi:hypothetical protein
MGCWPLVLWNEARDSKFLWVNEFCLGGVLDPCLGDDIITGNPSRFPEFRWAPVRLSDWEFSVQRSHPFILESRNAYRSSHKGFDIVERFNQNWNVHTNFSKTPLFQISWRSVPAAGSQSLYCAGSRALNVTTKSKDPRCRDAKRTQVL